MDRREQKWKIAEYILGGIGAALLVAILVLKILKFDIIYWTLPLTAVVILFLIADDRVRRLKRKRMEEEAKEDKPEETPQETLPKDAFEFGERKES